MSLLLFKLMAGFCTSGLKTEMKVLAHLSTYLRLWGEYLGIPVSCSFRLFADFSYCGCQTEISFSCWLLPGGHFYLPKATCNLLVLFLLLQSQQWLAESFLHLLFWLLLLPHLSKSPSHHRFLPSFIASSSDSSQRMFSAFKSSCNQIEATQTIQKDLPILGALSLIIMAKSLSQCNATYSEVPRIRV